ncbi:MAG: hypothetical protein ACTHMX_00490 [Thermomicrobiales bacterium]
MEPWHEFLVAMAGASGALVGLLFIAMSISLDQLMKAPQLLTRAAACLELLTGVLMFCCALLMPGLDTTSIGWIMLVGGILVWSITSFSSFRVVAASEREYRSRSIVALILFQVATVPTVVAGIVAFRIGTDAMYILAAAFIVSFAVSVLDAWVLMIEVRR